MAIEDAGIATTRWWFSWHGPEDDCRPVIWPMPEAWLGYWCSGSCDDYSVLVGWAEAETPEDVAALVRQGWPEWGGEWRIEPTPKMNVLGDRFQRQSWVDPARWGASS